MTDPTTKTLSKNLLREGASSIESALFAAGSAAADSDENWEELPRKLRAAPRGLTEAERCEFLIACANYKPISISLLHRVVGKEVMTGNTDGAIAMTETLSRSCRANLERFLDCDAEERLKFSADCYRDLLGKVKVFPSHDGKMRREQIRAVGINAAMQYALALMTDLDRQFAAKLCLCQLKSCGLFFFEKPPTGHSRGNTRKRFCSKEHMKDFDRERSRLASAKRRREAK